MELSNGTPYMPCLDVDLEFAWPGGRIEGEVLVNGHPQEAATFARISGYVCTFSLHIFQSKAVGHAAAFCTC